ncbi:MAG: hypothetical protein ACM3IJ_02050 [Candidatus Levyibacteriota bacterium]
MNIPILPHYYRKITARRKTFSKVLIFLELFLFCFLASISLYLFIFYQQIQRTRAEEVKSLASWEKLIHKYPNYPEVYFEGAVYAARLKDNQKAMEYLNKALLLNPNYQEAKKLQEDLGKW